MMTNIYSNKKTKIYEIIKEEIENNENTRLELLDCYCNDISEELYFKHQNNNYKVIKELFKLVKQDVRRCFYDNPSKNCSTYNGAVRLSDHANMANYGSSVSNVVFNIIR